MTPQAALQKQIEKYRAMTGEERLKLGLDLHELSCEIAREGIRHPYPDAGPDEVERLLRKRIALAQQPRPDRLCRLQSGVLEFQGKNSCQN